MSAIRGGAAVSDTLPPAGWAQEGAHGFPLYPHARLPPKRDAAWTLAVGKIVSQKLVEYAKAAQARLDQIPDGDIEEE